MKKNDIPMPKFFTVLVHLKPLWAALREGALYPVGGRVLDALTIRPVQGACVKVKRCCTAVHTNETGQFVLYLSEIPATLAFSHDGFIGQEITVSPPQEAMLTITMTSYR